jgi:hypothetical protein
VLIDYIRDSERVQRKKTRRASESERKLALYSSHIKVDVNRPTKGDGQLGQGEAQVREVEHAGQVKEWRDNETTKPCGLPGEARRLALHNEPGQLRLFNIQYLHSAGSSSKHDINEIHGQ